MNTALSPLRLATLALLTTAMLACGSEPPVEPPPEVKLLLPLKVGNRWTYRVTSSSGVVSRKIQTVTGTVGVDGELAFSVLTERGTDRRVESVQMVVDGRVVRVRESEFKAGVLKARYRYEPFGLRIDGAQVTQDATYQDRHAKLKIDAADAVLERDDKAHTFVIEAASEIVTVPIGDIDCVRVRRDREGAASKTFWYAPGLGKVKEDGLQTEELERAELP